MKKIVLLFFIIFSINCFAWGNYDKNGWHKTTGINRETETLYDVNGYDREGYNKDGYDKFNYDKNGFNKNGYDREGYNKEGYDKFGDDKKGFDKNGINLVTQTKYNELGYDKRGFDKEGINKVTKNQYDKDGYDVNSFDKNGINMVTKLKYDIEGFDARGFDKEGINKVTKNQYDKDGHDVNSFDKNGINMVTKLRYDIEGFDARGYNKEGINKVTKNQYDKEGYNKEGYDKEGYNKYGYDIEGYDTEGYDTEGYDKAGYNKEGYDNKEFNKQNINRKTGTFYDENHFTKFGNVSSIYYIKRETDTIQSVSHKIYSLLNSLDIKQDKFETTKEFEERKIQVKKEYEKNVKKLKNSIFVINLDSYYSDQNCSYNADAEEWKITLPTELEIIESSSKSEYIGGNAFGYETTIKKLILESDEFKAFTSWETTFKMKKELAKKQKSFILQILYKIEDVSKDVYGEDYLYQKPTISKPEEFFCKTRTLKIRYVGLIIWDYKKDNVIMSTQFNY